MEHDKDTILVMKKNPLIDGKKLFLVSFSVLFFIISIPSQVDATGRRRPFKDRKRAIKRHVSEKVVAQTSPNTYTPFNLPLIKTGEAVPHLTKKAKQQFLDQFLSDFRSAKMLRYVAVRKGKTAKIESKEANQVLASFFDIPGTIKVEKDFGRLALYINGEIEILGRRKYCLITEGLGVPYASDVKYFDVYLIDWTNSKRYSFEVDRSFVDFANYYFSEIIEATGGGETISGIPFSPTRPEAINESILPFPVSNCTIINDCDCPAPLQHLSDEPKTECEIEESGTPGSQAD